MLEPTIDILRFVISLPFFFYASYQDYRERMIDNRVWFYLGIIATVFDVIYFWEIGWLLLFIIPPILIFYEWFYEWESIATRLLIYGVVTVFLITPFIYSSILSEVYPFILISALMLFIRLLHYLRTVRGRADARALMLIALLQPLYPNMGAFPIFVPPYLNFVQVAFPFLFLVLLYASISSIGYVFCLFLLNVFRGDFGFPEMFIGYRVEIDEISRRHVWLMERIENGEPVLYIHPEDHTEEDIEKLKKFGRDRVWVQPQMPFIVFITIGLILSYLIGNFL